MTPEEVQRHAEMLANRVRKNQKKLGNALEREGIFAYRLYDWDIPEVRAVVDRYEDHLVVAEYARAQTADVPDYVGQLARAVGEALSVPASNLHTRRRRTRPEEGPRYGRLAQGGQRLAVRERELKFWVNLDDYLDTGLFADHRETRKLLGEASSGKRVLNLFAYTGTFTCRAALGGARETVTVDASKVYLDWAADNLELNGLSDPRHALVVSDVDAFLSRAAAQKRRFDLAVVDPPSFSSRFGDADFDVQRDHRRLLESVRALMADDGRVLFSVNHQRFEPELTGLPYRAVEEITEQTVPRDYRNRTVHRSFWLDV